MSISSREEEVKRNFSKFNETLPELLNTHAGKFVLMHNGSMIEFCDTHHDALILAKSMFPNSDFSIQEVKASNLWY
jgi:hypothetical protein